MCAFTKGGAEAQGSALEGRKIRDSKVLARCWSVGIPDRGLDLRSLHDDSFFFRLEELLGVYEAHGRFTVSPRDAWTLIGELGLRDHPLIDAANELTAMGIKESAAYPPESASPAIELHVTTGVHVDPESVNRAVEARATERGNVRKLGAATHATATHLFVPIYTGARGPFWAVEYVETSSTPVLPTEVTRAWVVGGASGVLYVEPPGDWTRVQFDPLATSDPRRWEVS